MTPEDRARLLLQALNARNMYVVAWQGADAGASIAEVLATYAQFFRETELDERERCEKVLRDALTALIGHANHGYGDGAAELVEHLLKAVREVPT